MGESSDTRGWVLTALSAVACCFGTTLICVDVIVRRFPGMKDFKIAESDAFLSASLSLSAGVILFTSLFSMLPESKNYLNNGDLSPKAASFTLIGLFMVGVFGIRIISQIMHKFIPSHVVDCDHTHDDEEANKGQHDEMIKTQVDGSDEHGYACPKTPEPRENQPTESSPLLSQTSSPRHLQRNFTEPLGSIGQGVQSNIYVTAPSSRRPSSNLKHVLTRTLSKYVSSKKEECDEDGPCMGFSDPCGQDCFKIVQKRSSRMPSHSHSYQKASTWRRNSSGFRLEAPVSEDITSNPDSNNVSHPPHEDGRPSNESKTSKRAPIQRTRSSTHHYHHPEHEHNHQHHTEHSHGHAGAGDHHHHVPTNAFMSIGLQTSIAIALHKAPEGFITFATNHASPSLGFSVFIALFIHNITDGFVLSLPLYLALNSRLKAIVYSSLLGGLSQPLGAGLAALWFKLSSTHGHMATDERAYGCVFAITAGVLASVALSLLAESLQLTHNKNACVAFSFVGMAILGVSQAFAAK